MRIEYNFMRHLVHYWRVEVSDAEMTNNIFQFQTVTTLTTSLSRLSRRTILKVGIVVFSLSIHQFNIKTKLINSYCFYLKQ